MQTDYGVAAWRILSTGSGQWIRSGLEGRVTGLDLRACFERTEALNCDKTSLEFLLLAGEAATIETLNRLADERKQK